jgi:tetratricopeptide (TPR) repeat protein
MSLEVGETVRVLNETGDFARKGMVSIIHEENFTVDVLYNDNEEELNVPLSRIRKLESFECGLNLQNISLAQLKEFGNVLFGLKDFHSATAFYEKAVNQTCQNELQIGSNVVVLDNHIRTCTEGMISGIMDGNNNALQYEIVLSNDEDTLQSRDALIQVPPDIETALLLRSIYLNLARCNLKLGLKGWAIRYASISLSIARILFGEVETREEYELQRLAELTKMIGDTLYFRAKTFLAANRPGLAFQVSSIGCRWNHVFVTYTESLRMRKVW